MQAILKYDKDSYESQSFTIYVTDWFTFMKLEIWLAHFHVFLFKPPMSPLEGWMKCKTQRWFLRRILKGGGGGEGGE